MLIELETRIFAISSLHLISQISKSKELFKSNKIINLLSQWIPIGQINFTTLAFSFRLSNNGFSLSKQSCPHSHSSIASKFDRSLETNILTRARLRKNTTKTVCPEQSMKKMTTKITQVLKIRVIKAYILLTSNDTFADPFTKNCSLPTSQQSFPLGSFAMSARLHIIHKTVARRTLLK